MVKTRYAIIKVTSCGNCPWFMNFNDKLYCNKNYAKHIEINDALKLKNFPKSCKLKETVK